MTKFAGQFRFVPELPVSIPDTDPTLIAPDLPAPNVSVTPLPSIKLLRAIDCAPKSNVDETP